MEACLDFGKNRCILEYGLQGHLRKGCEKTSLCEPLFLVMHINLQVIDIGIRFLLMGLQFVDEPTAFTTKFFLS